MTQTQTPQEVIANFERQREKHRADMEAADLHLGLLIKQRNALAPSDPKRSYFKRQVARTSRAITVSLAEIEQCDKMIEHVRSNA